MIRVLHITEDHSTRNTGISRAVDTLMRSMPDDIQASLACTGQDQLPVPAGVDLWTLPTQGVAKIWRFSPGGSQWLAQAIAAADVIHLHGLWMWIQWAAARQAVRMHKPFVLTCHGMLQPWIWQRQSWPHRLKKFLYWNYIAYPAFARAGRIHALTSPEATALKTYFPGQEPLVIPHSIDLQSIDRVLATLPAEKSDVPPYILFVGRLHPVKGIHLLIQAFAELRENPFMLKIAGPTQPQEQAYARSLVEMVSALGLEQRVIFTGAVEGAAKWQLYRDAWAFCLPSFSEVIGLVNLEAAAARTPVITTNETGIVSDWEQFGGICIRPTPESITAGLQQTIGWSRTERNQRGETMRALVERYYGQDQIASTWAATYQSLRQNY